MNHIHEHSYIRTCVQCLYYQHAHMISDGCATLASCSIDSVVVKVKPSLHQAFLQVIDVLNGFMHTLLYKTELSKFKAHDDPGPL